MNALAPLEDVRSRRSTEQVYVRFHNLTERTVEVIWADFTGLYVCYQVLQRGQFVDVNTFKEHPWLAFDHFTKDRLHVDGKLVYFPKTVEEYIRERFGQNRQMPPNLRLRVNITLPLCSLKFLCLLAVREYLKNPDDLESLELPKNLIVQLDEVVKYKTIMPRVIKYGNH